MKKTDGEGTRTENKKEVHCQAPIKMSQWRAIWLEGNWKEND